MAQFLNAEPLLTERIRIVPWHKLYVVTIDADLRGTRDAHPFFGGESFRELYEQVPDDFANDAWRTLEDFETRAEAADLVPELAAQIQERLDRQIEDGAMDFMRSRGGTRRRRFVSLCNH